MSKKHAALREVDALEIICLVDNCVDFTSSVDRSEVQGVRSWVAKRMGEKWFKEHFSLPIAEHGLSMLIKVSYNGKSHTVIFDAGVSRKGAVSNARAMGINLKQVEAIILSHGHRDHWGGLISFIQAIGETDLPIIVHEDMFKTRGVTNDDGSIRRYPNFPGENEISPAKFVKTKEPFLLADNTILVTGEIPRKTDFEKGYTRQCALINGVWQPDPWVWDDRALVINVKRKGLVIVSGCAHAGIINTVLYGKEISDDGKIHAIIGGFHLSGRECEERIGDTVKALKQLNPELAVPMHCTGWRGAFTIAKELPKAFVWSSVGNLYTF